MPVEKQTPLKESQSVVLSVRVHPRARKNQINHILSDGTVKISLTAPPVEGKANQALINFLSQLLDIPREQLTILAGAGARNKLVSVSGLTPAELNKRVETALQKS
jgi:hypothetical protein